MSEFAPKAAFGLQATLGHTVRLMPPVGHPIFTVDSNRYGDCNALTIGRRLLLRSLKRWLRQKTQKLIFVLLEPITKPLFWELERANLPNRDVVIANPLTAHGRKFFSQNDEDGILLEIAWPAFSSGKWAGKAIIALISPPMRRYDGADVIRPRALETPP